MLADQSAFDSRCFRLRFLSFRVEGLYLAAYHDGLLSPRRKRPGAPSRGAFHSV